LKIFKTAQISDMKLWSSCHCRHRRRRYRRHRRSRSIVKKKKEQCKKQNVSHGKKKIEQGTEKERVTVRSLFVVVVRRSSLLIHANGDGK
jgi:hypothetical protein